MSKDLNQAPSSGVMMSYGVGRFLAEFPLIGWITGKNPVLAKYGKRLFWIVFGLVCCSLAFLLIFMVPQALHANRIAVFVWMVIAVCLY